MSLIRKFLSDSKLTSLLKYRLKPLLEALFFSKTVLMSYLVAPGEAVRSLVKSLFLPKPMPAPDRLMVVVML